MRKLLIAIFTLLPASLVCLSCGGSTSTAARTSGVTYRAFISNSVSSGNSAGGVYIVDAQHDIRPLTVGPIAAGSTPGMMAVTPNRAQTLVYSGSNTRTSDNLFSIINNAQETASGHVTLPSYTESFVVSPDSSSAYVAVPNATVVGQSPGLIEVVNLGGAFSGEVEIPSVHYLSINNSGNRILAFSDVQATLAAPCDQTPAFLFVVTPSNVGVLQCPAVPVPGFDQPVQAFFSSDDSTAYVVNCGAECGGIQASVQPLNMINNTPGAAVGACTSGPTPQCAASVALLSGSTMYLAGTPYAGGAPSLTCLGQKGETLNCGMLTVFDLGTMSVVTSGIAITDGYHNRIALGANGQLFIGARTCTEIVPSQPPPPNAEVRGCLSIYNTLTTAVGSVPAGGVAIPPETGDVTGIQPVATRSVVYVVQGVNVQGGTLYIYDDTIDALEFNPNDPNNPGQIFGLVGDFFDVKTVDF